MSSRRTSNDATRWLSNLDWVSIVLGVVIARLASRDPRSCLTLTRNIGARQQQPLLDEFQRQEPRYFMDDIRHQFELHKSWGGLRSGFGPRCTAQCKICVTTWAFASQVRVSRA